MDFFQVIVLAIVEGFTEFLPISSTAHLILASRILNIAESDFLKSFTIAIQLGAILAVVVLYSKRCFRDWEINKRVVVAFIPTAIIGAIFYKIIKGVFFESLALILFSLFSGGVLLIVFEIFYKKKKNQPVALKDLPYWKVMLIGVAQALAAVPGVSRAAATVVGGMLLGVSRKEIVEFSFFLAVPTMAAATAFDLSKSAGDFSLDQFHLVAAGFIASFVFAILGVKFILSYIQKNSFIGFGIYRIFLAIFLFVFFFI